MRSSSFLVFSLRALAAVLVGSLAGPALSPVAASDITGFLAQRGHGTMALGFTLESYDEFWAGREKTSAPPLGEIETRSSSLYFRWGFTDDLSLVVNGAYVDAAADGPSGLEDAGFQDLSVLLAQRLWSRKSGSVEHSLVGALGIRTPTESYVADSPVARGDETTDGLVRLVYLLRRGGLYWSQQIGYDLRGDDAPDGYPLYTEVGYSAGRFTTIATFSRLFSASGTDIGDPGFTFPSNREEVVRLGLKAVVRLDPHWALFVGAFDTLDGRNTGDATGYSGGLVFDF